MLKIIAIFVLLALNNTSTNTTSLNNSSINDTLLNNSSMDDDWFNKSSKLNFALPRDLLLDIIMYEDVEQAGEKFRAEKTMTDPFSRSIIPRVIDNPEPASPDPELVNDKPERGCSEPVCTEDGICNVVCSD